MTNRSNSAFDDLAAGLGEHLALLTTTRAGNCSRAATGSLAARAASSRKYAGPTWGDHPLQAALTLAEDYIGSATEHIEAMQSSLSASRTRVAVALGRLALESAGRAVFLLTDGIDDRERVRRAMNEHLASLWPLSQYSSDRLVGERYTRVIEHMLAEAEAHGFLVKRPPNRPSIGAERASTTDLLTNIRPELGMCYRAASGWVHSSAATMHMEKASRTADHRARIELMCFNIHMVFGLAGSLLGEAYGWNLRNWDDTSFTIAQRIP